MCNSANYTQSMIGWTLDTAKLWLKAKSWMLARCTLAPLALTRYTAPLHLSTPSTPWKPCYNYTVKENRWPSSNINCQSTVSKKAAFLDLVTSPDIIVTTETWLDSIATAKLERDNLAVYRKERFRGEHGGVLVARLDGNPYHSREIPSSLPMTLISYWPK